MSFDDIIPIDALFGKKAEPMGSAFLPNKASIGIISSKDIGFVSNSVLFYATTNQNKTYWISLQKNCKLAIYKFERFNAQ